MTDRKKLFTLGIINLIIFIIFVTLQYSPVISLKIMNASPMLPLCLLVAISMFSSELTSAFSGLAVGIFIDATAATPSGFNSVCFLVIGLAVSLISKHLFNNNIFSSLALCGMCSLFYGLLRFAFWGASPLSFSERLGFLMRYIFPSAVYTTLLIIPLYYLEKYLYNKFYYSYHK